MPAAAPTKLTDLLTVCNNGVHYRGSFGLPLEGGSTRVVNILPMEDYLLGVVPRESPASWGDAGGGKGMNALSAQAVAARSYASAENRYPYARTCDTTSCQVYGGAGANGNWLEDYRTTQAVQGTAGVVRRMPNNTVARTSSLVHRRIHRRRHLPGRTGCGGFGLALSRLADQPVQQ